MYRKYILILLKGLELTCCYICLQITALILGILTIVDYYTLEPCNCVLFPLMMRHETVLAALGLCAIIIVIIGCVGACKESDSSMRTVRLFDNVY